MTCQAQPWRPPPPAPGRLAPQSGSRVPFCEEEPGAWDPEQAAFLGPGGWEGDKRGLGRALGREGAEDGPGTPSSPRTPKFQGKSPPCFHSPPPTFPPISLSKQLQAAPSPGSKPPGPPARPSIRSLAPPIHSPHQQGSKPGHLQVGGVVLLSKVLQPREAQDKHHRGQGAPQSCRVVPHGSPPEKGTQPGTPSPLPKLASKTETRCSREFFKMNESEGCATYLGQGLGPFLLALRRGEGPLKVQPHEGGLRSSCRDCEVCERGAGSEPTQLPPVGCCREALSSVLRGWAIRGAHHLDKGGGRGQWQGAHVPRSLQVPKEPTSMPITSPSLHSRPLRRFLPVP